MLPEQRDFESTVRPARIVEVLDQIAFRRCGQVLRQRFRGIEVLATVQIEHRATQHQGFVQALLHLDIEPAVDAAVEEFEREVVHDQQRRDDQGAEDRHGAQLEPRPDDVAAVIAHQLGELGCQQHQQHHDSNGVDQQDPGMEPPELRGVLRSLGQQEQCHQPQRHREPAEGIAAVLLYCSNGHVYHSLTLW